MLREGNTRILTTQFLQKTALVQLYLAVMGSMAFTDPQQLTHYFQCEGLSERMI
jgi:hypothetical protein